MSDWYECDLEVHGPTEDLDRFVEYIEANHLEDGVELYAQSTLISVGPEHDAVILNDYDRFGSTIIFHGESRYDSIENIVKEFREWVKNEGLDINMQGAVVSWDQI